MSEYSNILAPSKQASQAAAAGDVAEPALKEEQPQLLPVQCALTVGAPDDPLEDEADQMADTVMRMPAYMSDYSRASDTYAGGNTAIQRKCAHCEEEETAMRKPVDGSFGSIQRKCSHCEEEEKVQREMDDEEEIQRKPLSASITPFIQTKSNGAGTTSNALTSQINNSRGSGNNIDGETRSFMETRFGSDFSSVKIHTGSESVQMNRELNAKAFTVGNDIYFNQGQYDPGSDPGKHLLAHELTHTIQQGGAKKSIQRVPTPMPLPATVPAPGANDFLVDRVNSSGTEQIFFARGQSVLTADGLTQITAIKAAAPASVRLNGFASADETQAIAQARADAVKAALIAPPNPVTVSAAVGNASATAGRTDYSGARYVEILLGAAPSTTVNCRLRNRAGRLVNPPRQPCTTMDPLTWTAFNTAQPLAVDAMDRARNAANAGHADFNPALVDRFFGNHNAATLATLATNLGNLRAHVNRLPGITRCGGQCDTGLCDTGSVIAYNSDVDRPSRMTLCVPNFKSNHVNDQVRNLIHESAHGTSPLGGSRGTGTSDVAYRHERMMFQLSTAERLRNSDSYALFAVFVREVQTTGIAAAIPAGISTPATDTLNGFANAAEADAVNLALAKLEKRLTWAQDWSGQLYGRLRTARTAGWPAGWGRNIMRQAALRFPLTAPPARPSDADMIRMAAIAERYRRMKSAVKRDLTVNRMAAGLISWPASPGWVTGNTLGIGPDFFTATPANQISLLLENLAAATRDVEIAFIPAYVSFAEWMHNQNP